MQAYLAQYFPLGMADVDAPRPSRLTSAAVWSLLHALRRLARRRGTVLCHQP